MKKIISLILALALCASFVVVLASCGEAGQSAYEIAVAWGFEGTEAEWLESLKGQPGTRGKDGTDGKNGEDGEDGINGVNGKSAYELAKAAGFEGTEAEWQASLNGKDGKDSEYTLPTITVSDDGYLVVNGEKTAYKVAE